MAIIDTCCCVCPVDNKLRFDPCVSFVPGVESSGKELEACGEKLIEFQTVIVGVRPSNWAL